MFREVTKMRRCPVCGKPDWCCFFDKDSGAGEEMLICKRDSLECNVEGIDGKKYVYIGKSNTGNSIFEEYEQHMASRRNNRKVYDFKKAEVQRQLTPVDIIEPRENEYLNGIYKELLQLFALDDYHRNYQKSKGWTDELIDYYNLSTFPEPDNLRITYRNRYKSKTIYRKSAAKELIAKFGKDCLRGVPGAYMDKGVWTLYGWSGILYPMLDLNGNIKRLRIRMDYRDQDCPVFTDKVGYYYIKDDVRYYLDMSGIYTQSADGGRAYIKVPGKYRTLASFQVDKEAEEKGFFANKLAMGCQSHNEYSFYTRPGDDYSIVLITEGEPKGMYTNYKMMFPVLTASGVSSYLSLVTDEILETLKARGTKMIVIATDADKGTKQEVLKAEIALIKALKEKGVMVGLAEWNEDYGKGIDDCLAGGKWPLIKPNI